MDSVRDMAAGNYGIRALYAPIERGKGCFCAAFFMCPISGTGPFTGHGNEKIL